MPTALVTRPREDAEETAALLAGRGWKVMIEPLIDIVFPPGGPLDLAGIQGFLVTSANGARALAGACPERDLPLWAVGDASARTAAALGFSQVDSAGGDVDTLAGLVQAKVDPAKGALLHAAGSAVAGDLAALLPGYDIRRLVLYESRTAEALSEDARTALAEGRVDAVLIFSPRTAQTFATLAAGFDLGRVAAYVLSPAVARKLEPLSLRAVRTAQAPTQAALLAAFDQDQGA